MDIKKQFPTEIIERKNGKVAVITMSLLPPNNTLNLSLMAGLVESMNNACEVADFIILNSSNEKFFSNGLDGRTLLDGDLSTRQEMLKTMTALMPKLYGMPKPFVVEISGHAMAGGAVISVCADNRFMLRKGPRIGFSEMMVGLPLPANFVFGFKHFVNNYHIREMIEGATYKAEEAKQIGLIDAIADTKEELRTLSLKRADQVLRMTQSSYHLTRNQYRQTIIREIVHASSFEADQMIQFAAHPDFQKVISTIASKNE